MAPLPVVSGEQVASALLRAGFKRVDQKGSHVKFKSADGSRTVIVPMHRVLKRGTLASILRQANLSAEQLGLTARTPH